MNIIITGGAGFIGSHLVDEMIKVKTIKKITILDNLLDGSKQNIKKALKSNKVKFYRKDIRNFNSIKTYFKKIDVVVHLAALSDVVPSIENPREYLETNFNGTLNVLECMKLNSVKRIIYAASASCYGIVKKIPTSENTKISLEYPYSFSKFHAEELIKHYNKIYDIKYISLRLFNVYGTRSRTNSSYGAVLGVFMKQKLEGYKLTVVGNGNQKRDFVYVKDVCNAFIKAIFSKQVNKIYNVGYGNSKSINYLAKLIGGKRVYIPRRPGEPDNTQANISKIKKELKWKPKISLEEGIKEVKKNILFWKKSPLCTKDKIKKATVNWFKYIKNK